MCRGGIIPAKTGVLLEAEEDTYNFGLTTGGSVGENKLEAAVMPKSEDGSADANAFYSFTNDITGLVGIESSAAEADVYYDVQGRKVVAPQKGQLYIVNGKKVLY